MPKCIFCKKSHKSDMTSKYKCGITGKYLKFKCDDWSPKMKNCKHCKQTVFGRFLEWFAEKLTDFTYWLEGVFSGRR